MSDTRTPERRLADIREDVVLAHQAAPRGGKPAPFACSAVEFLLEQIDALTARAERAEAALRAYEKKHYNFGETTLT